MARKSLIRLASALPKGSDERKNLLKVLAAGPVELSEAVSKQAPQIAWPNVTHNGFDVAKAYMDVMGDAENRLWGLDDEAHGGQEAYLGYSEKHDMFVSGWDWWDTDGERGTGFVTLRMDGGRMRPMNAGYIEGKALYSGGGLNQLKREQAISHDLRLD